MCTNLKITEKGMSTMQPAPYYDYNRYAFKLGNRKWKKGVFLCLAAFFLFAAYNFLPACNVHKNAQQISGLILRDKQQYALKLMYNAMPVLKQAGVVNLEDRNQITDLLISRFAGVLMLDRHGPVALLERELPVSGLETEPSGAVPVMELNAPSSSPAQETGQDENDGAASGIQELSEETLVIIYNTHAGETYALTDGMDRLQGKRGGVMKAAAALEKELEENYGIRVARSEKINDRVYRNSYAESQKNLQNLLEEHPQTLAVFDIHRDAGIPRQESVITVDGKKAALAWIIVGSNARSPFPDWEQNYSFARKLKSRINDSYPGLCKKIRVQDGRYNQHLHPRALLLEVGSVSNSTEEAMYTARLLGKVLGPMLQEMREKE